MILATYDGAYLHLWKFELFNKKESHFEHHTHTARALLFPLIVWLLFIETSSIAFFIGLAFVALDVLVLGMDAYSEKESRSFMNGLPQWEYILHLFANSFHFAALILIIATRFTIADSSIVYSTAFLSSHIFETTQLIAVTILPGAMLLGLLHLFLASNLGKQLWNRHRLKITCC